MSKELSKPFGDKDLQWRVQQSGEKNGRPWAIIIPYVDARAIMDRLDQTVGPDGWTDSYEVLDKGVMCTLGVRFGDQWVSKEDGSDFTDVESFKGGISKAFVRAAVKFGMGRYLYDFPMKFAEFVSQKSDATQSAKINDKYYHWLPPRTEK